MKHANISFFIPHMGCPHRCTFCNQKTISGENSPPSVSEVIETASREAEGMSETRRKNTEIAFFGGSFTAIPKDKMIEYLEGAEKVVKEYGLLGIRLSTRPDAVSEEILSVLGRYSVRSVELGAQSTDDRVLSLNKRGHTAKDIIDASVRIKKFGFSFGLQIMPGLYGDTKETALKTMEDVISLFPDTVRIYPTVVVEGTELFSLYKEGVFTPLSLSEAVDIVSEMIQRFEKAGIEVIKVGLHSEESLEKAVAAGPFHPAFKELCENRIFYDIIKNELIKNKLSKADIYVNPKSISKAKGQRSVNQKRLLDDGLEVNFLTDDTLDKYEIKIGRI